MAWPLPQKEHAVPPTVSFLPVSAQADAWISKIIGSADSDIMEFDQGYNYRRAKRVSGRWDFHVL